MGEQVIQRGYARENKILTHHTWLVFGHANIDQELLYPGFPLHDDVKREPVNLTVLMILGSYWI